MDSEKRKKMAKKEFIDILFLRKEGKVKGRYYICTQVISAADDFQSNFQQNKD